MRILLIIYLVVVNFIGFVWMAMDKQKAVKAQYRIPEKWFFGISLIGGSLGSWIGMYFFHHKTLHWYFAMGIPLILMIQVGIIAFTVGKMMP